MRMPSSFQANSATTHPNRVPGRTTGEVRRAIRDSRESLAVLARRYGINPKTVAKWKKRDSTDDLPPGPRPGRHRRLTADEEEMIVRFREHTLLPLDDCHYALQARIPHLTRSSLHRCLVRHGISRLAQTAETGEHAEVAAALAPGHLHIDRATIQSPGGEHFLFSAIDEASRFAFVEMTRSGGPDGAASFLARLVDTVPFRISLAVTPDADPFANGGSGASFSRLCDAHGIAHLLKPRPHLWRQNPVARMGRALQDSVVFASEAYLAGLLRDFLPVYNFRRRFKALAGRTPFGFLCQAWQQEPERFLKDPHHLMVGLETASARPPADL